MSAGARKAYDIVTIGGGIGGAVLAKVMAEHGHRVLVVERERQFRDRVRGEALAPWGVGCARELGTFELLRSQCGHMLRYWKVHAGGQQLLSRDLFATTPQEAGWFTYYHPTMQETLLRAAFAAGAEVRRGAQATDVRPGSPVLITIQEDGVAETVEARLAVGADGRSAASRRLGGFRSEQDPARLLFAGVLLDGVPSPEDTFYHVGAPGLVAYIFPQGGGRARAYFGFHKDTGMQRLQGEAGFSRFRQASEQIGIPPEFYAGAQPAGPLATFDGADSWVRHPYANGVALIGDAAATSDPTWGQGMSLTLRDVRVLRDALLATSDWSAAGHVYAAEHDRHYDIIHRVDGWYADLFMALGPEADARRARALPLAAQDPTRFPEPPMSGPEAPHDDAVRRRFFGEE
jgi:2-polyprenyl-6-methoxyphenol hydroxylase-like FAD-dependent oxidoreductase